MKSLLLVLSFVSASALAEQGQIYNGAKVRSAGYGEVTINFGQGEIRYIEASQCDRRGGGPGRDDDRPRRNRAPHCQIRTKDNSFDSLANAAGETFVKKQGETTLDLLERAHTTGFCRFDDSDLCIRDQRQSKYYEACSPTMDTILDLKVNGILVASATSPSVCTYGVNVSRYGRSDFREVFEGFVRRIQHICPNNRL